MATPQVRQNGISKNTFFLTVALVAIVAFIAGTRGNDLVGAIAPVLGLKVETGTLDLSSVQRTYQALKANYDGKLDTRSLIDGASKGLVAAAGDKYTVFMDSKEATQFNNELSGQIGGGIGAEIGVRDGKPTVIRVLSDNPAEKAGLKEGDVITAVNGQDSTAWAADKTAEQVRGDIGTTVKLTVQRGQDTMNFTITRASVTDPSVHSEVKNGVGVLTISRFDAETGSLAQKAAESFKQQGVKSVILDLRDNGGGYLTGAQDVAGLWLNNQVVVSERSGGVQTDELKSGSNPLLAGLPTVVLVNGNTASASEVVSGALQEYKVATLIGEKTFGKGTVQKVMDLGDGTRLKVTVARWYTPKGRNITAQGIEPDKAVNLTAADVNASRDPQMQAALDYLNR